MLFRSRHTQTTVLRACSAPQTSALLSEGSSFCLRWPWLVSERKGKHLKVVYDWSGLRRALERDRVLGTKESSPD